MTRDNLTERERHILNHNSLWGSGGYGAFVTKRQRGRGWLVEAFPVVFATKRAAVAAWESYIDMLIDKKAGRL